MSQYIEPELLYNLEIPIRDSNGVDTYINYILPSSTTEPYTELIKLPKRIITTEIANDIYKKGKAPAQFFIRGQNLQTDHTYKLLLYTQQRNRGRGTRKWRHPSQTPQHVGQRILNGEIKSDYLKRGITLGYINLAGRREKYVIRQKEEDETNNDVTAEVTFPSIPNFMKEMNNGLEEGVLQTEWSVDSSAGSFALRLDLNQWIKPLYAPSATDLYQRPNASSRTWYYGYRPVKENKIKSYPKFFKFCLYDVTLGKTYPCHNILVIRQAKCAPYTVTNSQGDQQIEYQSTVTHYGIIPG